jgi:hypothetical protein
VLVEKEVIRPGVYTYLDEETGLPAKFEATPQRIQHFHDTGKRMLAKGLSIPVPLEHQQAAKPLNAAEKAANLLKDNAGWVQSYSLKDGTLFAQLDIPDPKIAEKLPTTIKWTSPWINSFVDGDGEKWDGVISHLALTTRPRIAQQQPFPSIAAALAIVNAMPVKKVFPKGLALSRAGFLKDGKPAYPMAFSLMTGIKLAEDEMPFKKKEGKEKESKEKPKGEKPEGEKPEGDKPILDNEMPFEPMVESIVDADGDISVYDVICDLLASEGYDVPEGTDKENFAERLYTVLMDKLKSKKDEGLLGDTMDKKPEPPTGAPPIVPEQPPLFMSLEDVNKITDPAMKAMALSMLKLNKKVEGYEQTAIAKATATRNKRIENLARSLPPKHRDMLVQKAASPAMKFSIGDDGAVSDPMGDVLDILEAGMASLPTLLRTPSAQLAQMEHPKQYDGESTPEQIKNAVECLTRGLPKEPAA